MNILHAVALLLMTIGMACLIAIGLAFNLSTFIKRKYDEQNTKPKPT